MIRTLLATCRASMAMHFSLMIMPIVLTVGGAIDYSRSVHFRSELQGVADSAALAGAALWTGGTNTAATTAATNYITTGATRLQPNGGLTQDVQTSSSNIGYQVDVTLTSSMTTTFLGFIMPSIAVTVYATALNPKPYGHFCAGAISASQTLCGNASAFSASAADTNTVYWYVVPADNSVPADTALTQLWSNGSTSNNPQPIPLDANQKIGFAMRNVTGNYGTTCTGSGHSRVCTQNKNQYGSTLGGTHTFYSHLVPPTNSTNGYNSTNNASNVNSVNGATGKNCALQVTVNASATGYSTAPSASGTCPNYNDANATTYATPSCAQLAGKTITFYFNDMGGTTDDKDFNDAVFVYYCGGNGSGAGGSTGASVAKSVVLIK